MKKFFIRTGIILFIIAIPITAYGYKQYQNIKTGVDDMQITLDNQQNDEIKREKIIANEPLTFLLLGIGDRPDDPGRADAIIVASVNPKKKEILTFNIPRDTKAEIIGKGFDDKMNHAYAYGGTDMTADTVEAFLDHSFDYLVQVNMQGLRDIVDVFGEIEVDNPFYFFQNDELGKETHHYAEGLIKLDGERALHYSRMRQRDPRGDFGRNDRQKQVIQAILDKASSPGSLLKIERAMGVISENVRTNISFTEVRDFYSLYTDEWHTYDMTNIELDGEMSTEDGVYYYLISEEEQAHIQHTLKEFTHQ